MRFTGDKPRPGLHFFAIKVQIKRVRVLYFDSLVVSLLQALIGHRVVRQDDLVDKILGTSGQQRQVIDRGHANAVSPEAVVTIVPELAVKPSTKAGQRS